MSNMLSTIVPKSDQLNADDLIGGQSKTIKVTKVSVASGDQPVALSFEGDNGKPYKPCKSMRRVLVNVWGGDGNAYVGRSMTLYCDIKVTFGGAAVGGIRISHMSDITEPVTMALTAAKASRKPFTVKPLVTTQEASPSTIDAGNAAADGGVTVYTEWLANLTPEVKSTVRPFHAGWTKVAKEVDLKKAEGEAA